MEATSLYGRLSTVELGPNAIARLLASDMRADLLAIMPEIFAREAFAERLAYSPDEAAELLGISRELVHDLLRTGPTRVGKSRTPQANRQTPPGRVPGRKP
jgi:hypothetical protein